MAAMNIRALALIVLAAMTAPASAAFLGENSRPAQNFLDTGIPEGPGTGAADTGVPYERPYGCTPEERPFTWHYGNETGPIRNIPGSVVDNTIETIPGFPGEGGTIVRYDPVNNVTVVTGNGGSIVSVHKGPP